MIIMGGDKKKKITAILGPEHQNVGRRDEEGDEDTEVGHPLMEEFISAVHAKDAGAAWDALKAAFLHLDAEPHEEGPHI